MEDDEYEIIYEEGVPVIGFQICSSDGNDDDDLKSLNLMSDSEIDGYQTLQYFHEDKKNIVVQNFDEPSKLEPKTSPFGTAKLVEKNIKKEPIQSDENVKFVIIRNATKCNSQKLYDYQGYSYTLRNVSVREGSSFWRCRFKVNNVECGAKLRITSDEKLVVVKEHRHAPDPAVCFASLVKTGIEPPKAKPVSRTVSKNVKSPRSVKNSKFYQMNANYLVARGKHTEPDEILDYFSEGVKLDEHKEEVERNLDAERRHELSTETDSSSDENSTSAETHVSFKVIKNGSLTGSHILYDSLGYSYSIQCRKGPNITWNCQAVLSSEGKVCGAKVLQNGTEFSPVGSHSHSPKRHVLLKINKMEIFSSQEKMNPLSAPKRNEQSAITPVKRFKSERPASDKKNFLSVDQIKVEKEESYSFSSTDVSFTVSLENPDDEPSGEEAEPAEEIADKGSLKRLMKTKRDLGDQSISLGNSDDMCVEIRDLAQRAFGSLQHVDEIKYSMIQNRSGQGGPKLFDSRGYFYTIRNNGSPANTDSKTAWCCCFRGNTYHCRAKVVQNGSEFTVEKDHCHRSDKEKFLRSIIRIDAVEMLKDPANLCRSGMSIVKSVMDNYQDFDIDVNFDHLVRFVNYHKKNFMESNDISHSRFTFNRKKIPKSFLIHKISSEFKFHLTFATEIQLAYLVSANEWYVDEAEFNVPPFTTLLSIHAYVYSIYEENPHQIPVFFALLSERREKDYAQVFSSIKTALNTAPSVTSIVIDLNIPLRKSLLNIFPNTEIKCCDRHWSEEIASKIKEIDLSEFSDDPKTMSYLYQLSLLNLLPRQDFETALCKIEKEISDDSVRDLICYIRETFGEKSLWEPKYWSSFKMPVQINNHELWRVDILNDETEMEVYSFIRTLYLLSKCIGDNLRLMSKKKIKKHYLAQSGTTLSKVYLQWKTFCKGETNCHKLLENLASIIHIF